MSTRPFYLQPRWVVGHVLIVALVILFVNLGFWQLDRLDQRKASNVVTAAALKTPVSATGTWAASRTSLVRYPIQDGQPGYYVVTPLITSGGDVLVNRGWIAVDAGKTLPRSPDSPTVVSIEGLARDARTGDPKPSTNEGNPAVPTVTHITSPYLQLTAPAPTEPTDPKPLPLPDVSEGSHFSYALQWFSFAALAVIGWAALLRRH